ncbi:hypothetical protein [Nocardiopsis sp. CC223A]|uniref:hypothetical protein n=1 Tax=Nocardiopsis sp. CC223A TaxID=3044051 RepID=UPI00278C6FFE|nr:hypothetical protein [Nocardiopsis sp. CC223A]
MNTTPLVRFRDLILERLAPKATAQAMPTVCTYQYRCVYRSATCGGVRESRQRRRVCDGTGGGSTGPWVTIGCC